MPTRARRLPLRPRRGRHEGLARRVRRRDRGVRRDAAGRAGSIALLITSDEEGPSVDGTVKVVEQARARRRAHRLLRRRRAVVGRRARRHDQERPARHAVGHAGRQGHPGPHRVSASRAKSDPSRRARARRTRERRTGTTATQYFPPTTFQCSNIHAGTGATNVIPGTLELHVQFPLFDREHARIARRAARGVLRTHRPRLRPRVDRPRQAVPDAGGAGWSTSPRRRSAR